MTTLSYRYEFTKEELEDIRKCHDEHGFAIVKGLISLELVEQLKDDVRQVLASSAQSFHAFIEHSPMLAQLMNFEPLMSIVRHLNDNEPITLNRSAAIYKIPGAKPMAWHTDWEPRIDPYKSGGVLNATGASSFWFYLTGSNPRNGGLAIIPDSHTEDWQPPEGFAFTKNQKSFHREGTEPTAYTNMDVPGMIPVVTEPGDLVIFAERTYHGVYPHQGEEPRLSCGMSFRKESHIVGPHWQVPDSAKEFIANCPAEVRPLVEKYIGIDVKWLSAPKSE